MSSSSSITLMISGSLLAALVTACSGKQVPGSSALSSNVKGSISGTFLLNAI